MNDQLKKQIEEQYGLAIGNVVDAPRQFVAETYILECKDVKYFCKIVTKPLFIQPLVKSLPVLNELRLQGLERVNYPIPTKRGKLYLKENGALIVLFNYIDAKQSENYDFYSLGKLIATVHDMASKVSLPVAKEGFVYQYAGTFEKQFNDIITSTSSDEIAQLLKALLTKYLEEINHDYTNFMQLCQVLKTKEFAMVITHGDPGGNILAKSPTELYLIDWDNILLAPPERDTWFFQHETEFIRGYRSIFPKYQANEELSHFFTYKRYFEDLVEYFAEILGDGAEVHRQKNLNGLESDCLEGWLRPSIRRFDPIPVFDTL